MIHKEDRGGKAPGLRGLGELISLWAGTALTMAGPTLSRRRGRLPGRPLSHAVRKY